MFTLTQLLADLAVLLQPVMPQVAESMATTLGLERVKQAYWDTLFSGRHLLAPGTPLGKPEALFPRIDTDKVQAKAAKAQKKANAEKKPAEKKKKAKPSPAESGEITIEEFARVDLKVGVIREAAAIAGADKLLKLKVDIGEDQPRPVVAGIAQHYKPDELIGKRVLLVANLKPAKLRGEESRGMVLASVFDDQVRVVEPVEAAPPGAKVR
jgi:methionyl-tRNA synthetase